jgi:hypothetical protein
MHEIHVEAAPIPNLLVRPLAHLVRAMSPALPDQVDVAKRSPRAGLTDSPAGRPAGSRPRWTLVEMEDGQPDVGHTRRRDVEPMSSG